MQYTAVILALAGAAFAQLPGVPACAATAVQGALDAVGGPKGITDLCTDKNGVLTKLRSDLQAICSCADQNGMLNVISP